MASTDEKLTTTMMNPYHDDDILNKHSTKLNYPIRSSIHPIQEPKKAMDENQQAR